MSDIYYVLETLWHKYQVLVTHDFGKKTYMILNLDGKECLSVNVKHANNELYISMLRFHESCSFDSPMTRGRDTIDMLKALLQFLAQKESFLFVSFIDISSFECALHESNEPTELFDVPYTIVIPLAFHNITIYGKTWYERHFGAYVSNNVINERIHKSIERLNTIITKDDTFSRFHDALIHAIQTTESTTLHGVLQYVIELLQASIHMKSWTSFFESIFGSSGLIANKYGISMACSLYYTFDAAVNELFLLPFECESLPMEIKYSTIVSYPEIQFVQEITNPIHRKSWSGTRRHKLPKYLTIPKYYTQLSLKRKYKSSSSRAQNTEKKSVA
jgi:hypothetical protein